MKKVRSGAVETSSPLASAVSRGTRVPVGAAAGRWRWARPGWDRHECFNTSQASTSTEGTPVPIATEHARLKGLEVRSVGPGIDESRCRLEGRPVDVEDGQAVRGVELHGARARVVRALVQRDQRACHRRRDHELAFDVLPRRVVELIPIADLVPLPCEAQKRLSQSDRSSCLDESSQPCQAADVLESSLCDANAKLPRGTRRRQTTMQGRVPRESDPQVRARAE